MDDRPRSIYKYAAPERVSVISERLIRHTQLGAFNDPFEGRPSISALSTPEGVRQGFRDLLPEEMKHAYATFSPDVRALLPYEQFTQIFTAYANALEPNYLALIERFTPTLRQLLPAKLDEFIGVLSLSEVPDNLLMWSHYAASHSGFVLGFDGRHTYFDQRKAPTDEFRHLRRVVYRDTRPRGPMTGFDGVDVFLVKSLHWAYEREWRVLRALKEADSVNDTKPYPICLFRFPPELITEVILGARSSAETKAAVTGILCTDPSLSHVKLRQAFADDDHFMLNIADVDV